MSGQNTLKLNTLLAEWPQNRVVTSTWLEAHGVYRQLIHKYVKGGWIQKLAAGAYQKAGDQVDWSGALNAIQEQLRYPIHLGGASWISLKGYGQQVPITSKTPLNLYGRPGVELPRWFRKGPWSKHTTYSKRSFFGDSTEIGLTTWTMESGLTLVVSSLERAFIEMVDDMAKLDFEQLYEVCERLTGLRPALVQELLENCTSFQTKRIFLFMAERCGHAWFKKLNLNKIDLGKGKRTVFKKGRFNSKYQITVPRQFGTAQNEE
jgi:hypothetical protein